MELRKGRRHARRGCTINLTLRLAQVPNTLLGATKLRPVLGPATLAPGRRPFPSKLRCKISCTTHATELLRPLTLFPWLRASSVFNFVESTQHTLNLALQASVQGSLRGRDHRSRARCGRSRTRHTPSASRERHVSRTRTPASVEALLLVDIVGCLLEHR